MITLLDRSASVAPPDHRWGSALQPSVVRSTKGSVWLGGYLEPLQPEELVVLAEGGWLRAAGRR
jgi:hypothetical protein